MKNQTNTLSLFHPLISQWFTNNIGKPTDVQTKAWPKIAAGEHVLITAPTGSGKTLTAFLWALNQLITGKWQKDHTRVLYVSPLKALNNDIQRNLLRPLAELKNVFEKSNTQFPEIHVQTRSGDTPQTDRRRMLRHPPEILITTPESLNLLLSSTGGRSILTNLSTVILDEIHGVINTKRGTHLITAVERLVPLSGEFQRISLSATIKPLETVAKFVGGYQITGNIHNPEYKYRPVTIIESPAAKKYSIQIQTPKGSSVSEFMEDFWKPVAKEFKSIILQNRSTLLFVNNRRLAEKLTLQINLEEEKPIAYAHHGSLAKEIRFDVEQKLKNGELRAIVATSSLEMGIDIGSLDKVILIQTPFSISSAIQRVGRAGHQVNEISKGTIFPTHNHSFLEAAVLAPAILSQEIEDVKPVECPMDVLAQIIVSMTGVETWDIDTLLIHLRTSYPFRNLTKKQFDLIMNMLAGQYQDTRIRELKARISIDSIDNNVAARKGALLDLYMSGGMIPDRGYFHLRHKDSGALIGELDEEFVWEARIGETFSFGTQNWKIERITHNDVLVTSGDSDSLATPFWKAEQFDRDFHYSMKIAQFLENADENLNHPDFALELQNKYCMEPGAADRLISYLKKQKQETESSLPNRHHLLIEHVAAGPGGVPGNQLVLHTCWGGKVNRPYAMILDSAWEAKFGHKLEISIDNDCIIFLLPHDIHGEEILSLVSANQIESLLRKNLEGSGFFGARFRECAGRALLLKRSRMSERLPLWMSRLRSQKLLKSVLRYEDFPILLEAWRTCLQDEFDLDGLRQMLSELESSAIRFTECYTNHPSPMTRNLSWRQINKYMYIGDELQSDKTSKLRKDLLQDIVFTPQLRPTISNEIIEQFELKTKRLSPGYSPSTPRDLIDWVKERLLIPESEWKALLKAIDRDHENTSREIIESTSDKLISIHPSDASEPLITASEILLRIRTALYNHLKEIHIKPLLSENENSKFQQNQNEEEDQDELFNSVLSQWLQFYGPVTLNFISKTLGIDKDRLIITVQDLIESQQLISGNLITDSTENHICDSENFEILLRISRKQAIPKFEPLDIEWFPLFMAVYQGLCRPSENIEGLFRIIEQLLCYQAPAELWESEIFPARLRPYHVSWLDSLMQQGDLRWIGNRNQQISFCFETDMDLLQNDNIEKIEQIKKREQVDQADNQTDKTGDSLLANLFKSKLGRYDFSSMMKISNMNPSELSDLLWNSIWKGKISNDTFISLRKGIETGFKLPDIISKDTKKQLRNRRSGSRGRFSKWKGSLPYSGNWFAFPEYDTTDDDLIELEERKKDRIRLLLDRYGILFREIFHKEVPPFNWSNLFRSLRLMELSGEVLAGYFFHGIPGPQFISHRAFQFIQKKLPVDSVYWLNAADPSSCCGLNIEKLKAYLPKRLDSNYLVYRGKDLVMTCKRKGKELIFHVPPDDPKLTEYLSPLHHLLTREFQPLNRIKIESINDQDAAKSPYIECLQNSFNTMIDYKYVTLYRQID
jgi:ATP-dependent Lhr-like helicase